MSGTDPLLTVSGVSVRFGGLSVLEGLNLELGHGGVTALIGPNGAGKSTLFDVISGRRCPDRGVVRFRGQDVTGWPPERLCRFGMGRCFQVTSLFAELTVEQHLLLACAMHERPSRLFMPVDRAETAHRRAWAILEQLGLQDIRSVPAAALSHGDSRTLEVALALGGDPALLLLDEPTQGMSATDARAMGRLIRKLARDRSILLVEHDVDLVMEISDRVVVLHQGRIIADGVPDVVRDDPQVMAAYFGG